MNYKAPTGEITEMWNTVAVFFATSQKNDRGDGFKEGTPNEIVAMYDKIKDYYKNDGGM